MPLSDAIAELKRCEGSHSDPHVVHVLLNVVARSDAPVIHETFLDDKTPVAPVVATLAGAAPSAVRRRAGLRAQRPSRPPASSSAARGTMSVD